MNIKKYEAYFHDGNIIEINHKNTNIILSLSSAEVVWHDFPPKEKLPQNCSVYKIYGGKIYWESIPDLVDPFC